MRTTSYRLLLSLCLGLCLFGGQVCTHAAPIPADLRGALHKANAGGKLLLVDFYGDWCPWCVKMDGTLLDAGVKKLLKAKFYYYKLDVGHFDQHVECLQQYGVKGIPFIAIFKPDGSLLTSADGYLEPDGFMGLLQKAAAAVKVSKTSSGKTAATAKTRKTGNAAEPAQPAETIHPALGQALHNARVAHKLLLVNFFGAANPECLKMGETLKAAAVKATLKEKYYFYKLDVGHLDKNNDLTTRYGVQSVPYFIVFNTDGSLRACFSGYADADSLDAFLKRTAGKNGG